MSGFVGCFRRDGTAVDGDLLTRMTAEMAFRGPDEQQTWMNDGAGMGVALLRTTFEAAQERGPASLDGACWLAGDLRLAGRDELLHQLRAHGRTVATDAPDSVLVLHAYAVWGAACLDYLIGDFAFVIWDDKQQRLLGARDHFGVAQFFYAQTGATLVVGNTLQSLMLHPEVRTDLDEQAQLDCALFGMFVDDDATAYAAVRRLPQGHRLTWDARGVQVASYWTPDPDPAIVRYRNAADYVEHFRTLFGQVIADCLRTDRAGAHLSGGMDSASVVVTASTQLAATGRATDLRGYTMIYRDLIADDEGDWAAQVAATAQIPQEFIVSEDVLAEPSATPSWLPPEPGAAFSPGWDDAAERTLRFARVLLTGFGGDALLYPPPLSAHAARAAVRSGAWLWPLRTAARQWRRRTRTLPKLPDWLNQDTARTGRLLDRQALLQKRNQSFALGMTTAPLWRTIFAWSDPGYTGRPLVLRFPFFDRRLFDFVRSIPPAPWLEHKHLLRAAMKTRLPAALTSRPKTPLQGNPTRALYIRSGVPAWEIDALAAPAMARYIDRAWLAATTSLAPVQQAETWAAARPPVQLAYWLQHYRALPAPAANTAEQYLASSSKLLTKEPSHATA